MTTQSETEMAVKVKQDHKVWPKVAGTEKEQEEKDSPLLRALVFIGSEHHKIIWRARKLVAEVLMIRWFVGGEGKV